jgi:hypothetical protein
MRRARTARWTVHLAVLLLLLKATVPMLASVAAAAQGRSVAEICDVYGVALPRHHGTGLTPHVRGGETDPPRGDRHHVGHVDRQHDLGHVHHVHHVDHIDGADSTGDASPALETVRTTAIVEEALSAPPPQAPPLAEVSGEGPGGNGHRSSDTRHAGDHCVLTVLAAAAAPAATGVMPFGEASAAVVREHATGRALAPDASERWAALLNRGPPAPA